MLVRLSEEVIGKRWDIIKWAIKSSAVPTADTNEKKLSNIQKALLSGQACCWIEGDDKSPRTLVITNISIEEVSKTKNLLVYCAHGFRIAKSEDYVKMVKGIYAYAMGCDCDNIIMYVSNPKIVRMLKSYGAQVDYVLAIVPL